MTSVIYLTSRSISKHVLIEKYTQKQLSLRDIAKQFSCSKTYIKSQLIKHNIALRSPSKIPESRNKNTYGKRKVSDEVIDFKKEQAVIDAIIKMHNDGASARNIAKTLNIMKVPTKRQGKKWHHYTIINILKRENKY